MTVATPARTAAHPAHASHALRPEARPPAGGARAGHAPSAPGGFADLLRNETEAAPADASAERDKEAPEATPTAPDTPPMPRPLTPEAKAPGAPGEASPTEARSDTGPSADEQKSDALAALRDALGDSRALARRHAALQDGARRETQGAAEALERGQSGEPLAGRFTTTLDLAQAGAAQDLSAPAQAGPAGDALPQVLPDGGVPSLGPADLAPTPQAPAAAAEASTPTAQAHLPQPPGSPGFAPALGVQLSTWLRDGVQHASLELNPQTLGPIEVRIAVHEGQAQVALSAEVASTRAALAEALPQLAAALGDAGLSLSGGCVSEQGAQRQGPERQTESARMRAGDRAGDASGTAAAAATPAAVRRHRGLLDLYA